MTTEQRKDGGSAFPTVSKQNWHYDSQSGLLTDISIDTKDGISVRDYSCIKLAIPETDKDWLNEIILKKLRNDFAAAALTGVLLAPRLPKGKVVSADGAATAAYRYADSMLAEREKGK